MDAKEYLGRARRADRRVSALLERRRRCLELEEAMGGARPETLAALEAELGRQVEDWARQVMDIEAVIDAVEDERCRDVLRYRYLNGLSWQAIAGRTHYSREWLWRTHARALAAAGEVLAAREG